MGGDSIVQCGNCDIALVPIVQSIGCSWSDFKCHCTRRSILVHLNIQGPCVDSSPALLVHEPVECIPARVGIIAPGLEGGAGLDPADAVRAAGAHGNRGGVPAVGPERAADDTHRCAWFAFIHLDGQGGGGAPAGIIGAGAGDHVAGCIGGDNLFGGAGLDAAHAVNAGCLNDNIAGIPGWSAGNSGGVRVTPVGAVLSILMVTSSSAVPPSLVALHFRVAPAVSPVRYSVVQPSSITQVESSSSMLQARPTLLVYQSSAPSVPVMTGVITGGVMSGELTTRVKRALSTVQSPSASPPVMLSTVMS